MAVAWTLKRGTEQKTLAAWGITAPVLNLVATDQDSLSFQLEKSTVAGADGWVRDAAVTLYRDITVMFRGIVENDAIATVDAGRESLGVRVVGPWWYLTHTVFQQAWKVWDSSLNGGEGGFTTGNRSHVILGQADDGTRLHSGQVITAALNWASAGGTRFAVGTIDPAVSIPLDEASDLTCAEVIMRMLRWTPDAVCWFDYSTTVPTFHCRRAANLTLDTYGTGAGSNVVAWTSRPRGDLLVDGVVIKFERTDTNAAGTSVEKVIQESSPLDADDRDPRVLVLTIPLEGASATVQTAQIVTEEIPAALNTAKDWWRARLTVLEGVADADITLNVTREKTQLYELKDGSIPDWLSQEANAEEDVVSGTVRYVKNGETFEDYISHAMTVCSLQSGTRKHVSREGGETAPTGLAEAFFGAVGTLYYDGSLSLESQDVGPGPWLGRRVQPPTGGSGIVQTATLDIEAGSVDLTFGPPEHLGPQDMVAFQRANRSRMTARSAGRRNTGLSADSAAEVQTGGKSPRHNTTAAHGGQLTKGETTPTIGRVVPAPSTPFQALVAVTSAEDPSVAAGQTAWRPGPIRISEA